MPSFLAGVGQLSQFMAVATFEATEADASVVFTTVASVKRIITSTS